MVAAAAVVVVAAIRNLDGRQETFEVSGPSERWHRLHY